LIPFVVFRQVDIWYMRYHVLIVPRNVLRSVLCKAYILAALRQPQKCNWDFPHVRKVRDYIP